MDAYLDFVSRGMGKKLARQLGLPTPVKLRRYSPGAPLVDGPVRVIFDDANQDDGTRISAAMETWGVQIGSELAAVERWGAVLVVLTGISTPADLEGPALELGRAVKRLGRSGRVVVVSMKETAADSPALGAARAAVTGLVRSLGKELRAGATANGIVVNEGIAANAPSVLGTLRFLLSAKSAYVDGQVLHVTGAGMENPALPLEGRVAVVTGAGRGIGATIVEVLARDGAHVIGVDVPASDSLASVMNSVRGLALHLDVTAPDAADQILRAALTRYGRLDIVVHNAGILRDKLLANMTEDRWHDLMAVNLAAPLAMNATFLEAAQAGQLGDAPRIISMASTSGIAGNRGQTNYAAAKSGLIGMTESLAAPLAAVGGTANAVAPGFIETDMTARIPTLMRQVARRMNSLQQGGQPIDVAETIAFLASPAGGGLNGAVVRVCGQHLVGR